MRADRSNQRIVAQLDRLLYPNISSPLWRLKRGLSGTVYRVVGRVGPTIRTCRHRRCIDTPGGHLIGKAVVYGTQVLSVDVEDRVRCQQIFQRDLGALDYRGAGIIRIEHVGAVKIRAAMRNLLVGVIPGEPLQIDLERVVQESVLRAYGVSADEFRRVRGFDFSERETAGVIAGVPVRIEERILGQIVLQPRVPSYLREVLCWRSE